MILIKKNGQLIRGDGKSATDIFVIVSENGVSGIIEDKEVPELTEEQLQDAYNHVVNGAVVIIASELGEYFVVKQACEESDNPVIYFDYADSHILRYELGDEVEITAKEIGAGAVESVNGKVGVVVLNASDILAQNAQTIQQNLARIDEEINRVEGKVDDVAEDLETEVSARESLDGRVQVVEASVSDIEALIPSEASSSNKLADKQFVNSSIATNTAIFRGTYDVVEDLGLTQEATHEQVATALASEITTKTNNDYAFVFFKDAQDNITRYDRYKYNGSAFAYEYTLNNSSFTAQQWAAINSGITAAILATLAQTSLIAPAYDNTATYSVGDKCTYNGKLYTCSTAITTAEDFNSSHWTEISVSSGFAGLDSNNTFTGTNTFSGRVTFNGGIAASEPVLSIHLAGTERFRFEGATAYTSRFVPLFTHTFDLGSDSLKYRNAYLLKIYGATQSANTDDIINGTFNVINASDIVNNTLTQAQYDLITNGKPTLIKGTLLNKENPIILTCTLHSGSQTWQCVYVQTGSSTSNIGKMQINANTKVISIQTITANNVFAIDLDSIQKINGKPIPSYPANNVDGQLVYRNNAMAWLDDTPVIDTTSTSYSGGISSNKEYSFTQPLTALNITTLNITTGDNLPIWSIVFTGTSGMTVSLPDNVKWANGTAPNFTQGKIYKIMISQFGSNYLAVAGEF